MLRIFVKQIYLPFTHKQPVASLVNAGATLTREKHRFCRRSKQFIRITHNSVIPISIRSTLQKLAIRAVPNKLSSSRPNCPGFRDWTDGTLRALDVDQRRGFVCLRSLDATDSLPRVTCDSRRSRRVRLTSPFRSLLSRTFRHHSGGNARRDRDKARIRDCFRTSLTKC